MSDKKEDVEQLNEGDTLVVRGDAAFDKYEHDVTIRPVAITLTQLIVQYPLPLPAVSRNV